VSDNDPFDDEYDDDLGEDGYDGPDEELDDYDDFDDGPIPLDEHETVLVRQDLLDLANFEATFSAEGYRGVSVFCQDCVEDHFYPWDMLRENLTTLLETGETPVHEPAFRPDPDEYIPWEYARGYVDALQDAGVDQRLTVGTCGRCGLTLPDALAQASFCPRCGEPLFRVRLMAALADRGVTAEEVTAILREIGLPG
jgi:ribosomal protein S27AE